MNISAGRVTGVRTERGDISAPVVVVAGGAWSTRLLWKFGIKLPQRPIRNTVLATTPAPTLTRTVVWAEGCAIRQDDTGRFILSGGGPSDTDAGLDLVHAAVERVADARALHAARRVAIEGLGAHAIRHERAVLGGG